MGVGWIVTIIVCSLLAPSTAAAFGPAAHLEICLRLLDGTQLVAPAVFALINKYPRQFLFGALAADIIIGKNRVAAHDHCHHFSVAAKLFNQSLYRGPAMESFMRGYLSHLGADVVAHNYLIPRMLVAHYDRRGVGHLYFETRADHRVLTLDPDITPTWNQLMQTDFKKKLDFLSHQLVRSIFPNPLSIHLYNQNLKMQKGRAWRRAVAGLDNSKRIIFSNQSLLYWRKLALFVAATAVNDPNNPRLLLLDPTGHNRLHQAAVLRRRLRAAHRRKMSPDRFQQLLNRSMKTVNTVDIDLFWTTWNQTETKLK